LENPKAVASLIFGKTLSPKDREKLLFEFSKDHGGSCALSDNPCWATMMRILIVPRVKELPHDWQGSISWYQRVHGL
jgi:hypothetical protein